MTRQQAQKEAAKRWGSKAIVRASEAISSPEKRAEQSSRNAEIRTRTEAINAEIDAKLKALPWYVELLRERSQLREELRRTEYNSSYYKFSVGKDVGIAFHVLGSGDTWEEAFAKADRTTT